MDDCDTDAFPFQSEYLYEISFAENELKWFSVKIK